MDRVKIYFSMTIFLISSIIGISILMKEDVKEEYMPTYVAYNFDEPTTITTTTTNFTTTSTTSTTTTTATTTKKQTTTTSKVTTTKAVEQEIVPVNNTMRISNYNKTWYLKPGNASYSDITGGNTYAVLDNRLSFDSQKMIIYGHSYKKGGGLFNYLQNYDSNYDFFKQHNKIYITLDGREYEYEIFSVYVVGFNKDTSFYSDELEYFYGTNYSYSNWEKTLLKYKAKSQYNTGVSVRGSDKIIILQTCSLNTSYTDNYDRANLLIFARTYQK